MFTIAGPVVLGFALIDGETSREFDDDGSTRGSALTEDAAVIFALLLLDVNGVVDTVICVGFSA